MDDYENEDVRQVFEAGAQQAAAERRSSFFLELQHIRHLNQLDPETGIVTLMGVTAAAFEAKP